MAEPSFRERFEELQERMSATLSSLDLRGQIEAHPWELVGTAALLGAWLGFEPPRVKLRQHATTREKITGVMVSAVGALAVRVIREAALRRVGEVAKRWWDESQQRAQTGTAAAAATDHPRPVM